jgi:AcrR family transcriptional regulator
LETSQLRASERCCELFIARGTTDLPIAEIAEWIGVSQRTFHRYFPFKARSISPVLDWTTRRFNEALQGASAESTVTDALRPAFRAGLGGQVTDRTRSLFPLVFHDVEMWSVFLLKVHDGERALAPVIARRRRVRRGSHWRRWSFQARTRTSSMRRPSTPSRQEPSTEDDGLRLRGSAHSDALELAGRENEEHHHDRTAPGQGRHRHRSPFSSRATSRATSPV